MIIIIGTFVKTLLRVPQEKGRRTIRVREREGGLEISWSHFRFIKQERYSKSTFRSVTIPKGRADMYRHHSRGCILTDEELVEICGIIQKNPVTELEHIRRLSVETGIIGQTFGFGQAPDYTACSGGVDVRLENIAG